MQDEVLQMVTPVVGTIAQIRSRLAGPTKEPRTVAADHRVIHTPISSRSAIPHEGSIRAQELLGPTLVRHPLRMEP
jgi:hypothetical protein